jgi:carbon starvation protein CstA
LLDFILTTNLVKLRGIYWVLLFPLAWLVFSILRGLATDWWAYWFLNPNDKGGLTQMIEYIFGICAFLIVAALISLGLNRALGKVRK